MKTAKRGAQKAPKKKDGRRALAVGTCSASGGLWTYSRYRAMLRKDGKAFAIVSPDGRNALADADIETLLRALNSETALDTVLHDVNYKGGLQYWIARHDALFLELCKARGVLPNTTMSQPGGQTHE